MVQLVLFSSHLVLSFKNQFPRLLFREASCVSDVVGVCYKTLMFGKKLVVGELFALELRKCFCELCASSNACIYPSLHVSMCAHTYTHIHALQINTKYLLSKVLDTLVVYQASYH